MVRESKAESRLPTHFLRPAVTDCSYCDPVVTPHLETGQVEAQTKSLYDHGCPASQDTLTHTAGPPASGHPGTAHVSSVRPGNKEGEEEDEETLNCVTTCNGRTCCDESNRRSPVGEVSSLRWCSARRSSCSERSSRRRPSEGGGKRWRRRRARADAGSPGRPGIRTCGGGREEIRLAS